MCDHAQGRRARGCPRSSRVLANKAQLLFGNGSYCCWAVKCEYVSRANRLLFIGIAQTSMELELMECKFPPRTLTFLEPGSPAVARSVLGRGETHCLASIRMRWSPGSCPWKDAWHCNPSWEGQTPATWDFQVSFWSSEPLFAAWPHVPSHTATVLHLPYRTAHLLPRKPFEVQRSEGFLHRPPHHSPALQLPRSHLNKS